MRKLIFIFIALISFSQAQTIQYIGAPTTTVISRGNFRTDSIFYLPKRTKTPTDTAAFRYQISDSSLYYWTGYQWTKVQSASSFASVDTLVISTRAYRQKGDDSLGAIIATKGSGTVTSVATGYGLSGGTITTTGTLIADTLNLSTRAWRQKGLDSLAALEISGSGTTNYVPKFTNTRELGNSNLINASSGDLLFGTTLNPYAATNRRTFEMNGTNETVIALKRNDLDGAYLYANANDFRIAQTQNLSMTFYTNNTERMRIFQNGRVFVGLSPTDAGYQFDVNGSGRFQQLTSSTNFLDFAHYFYNGGGTNDIYFSTRGNGAGSGNASIINTVSGARLSFHTNGGAIRFGNTSQTAATANYLSIESNGEVLINTTTDAGAYTLQNNGALYNTGSAILAATSGNVGIGTTSPSQKFEVSGVSSFRGDIYIGVPSTTNGRSYYFNATNTGRGEIYYDGTNNNFRIESTYGGSGTSQPITFWTGFNERVRINEAGESLFGTTTDAGNYRVQVSGNAYISGILNIGDVGSEYINVTADQNSSVSTRIRNNNTGSSAYAMVGVNASGNSWGFRMGSSAANNNALEIVSNAFGTPVSRLNITTGGIVGIGTTSPNASSIVDISSTTGGFLPPRMTTAQRDAISSPAAGLVIYNTTTSKLQVYTTSWTDLH